MSDRKEFKPLSLDEAEAVCYEMLPGAMVLNDMDDVSKLIYAEVVRLHRRIDEIENQAADMMSPEKMADMASSFLGGGFKL